MFDQQVQEFCFELVAGGAIGMAEHQHLAILRLGENAMLANQLRQPDVLQA
jgi:hypothetical protein